MDHEGMRRRLWRSGKLESEDFPIEEISDHLAEEDALIWVDIRDPGSDDLRLLADELALDPLAVEDAVSNAERAKVTRYATHSFLTVYSTRELDSEGSTSSLKADRISAFIFKRGILTVRQGDEFDIDSVVARWDENSELLKYGVGALVHGLLDVVVDGHFDTVQILDNAIESLEDSLFANKPISKEVQRRTFNLRKDLVQLRRVVLPMREVVNSVMRRRDDVNSPPELDSWFADLYDHVLRATEWTESLRDMVTTVFETNLSLQDARLNTVMKQLTAWAAIVAVPTAVTGYFGQNVPYPGFGKEWGFVLSVVVIVAIASTLYFVFKRRDWL